MKTYLLFFLGISLFQIFPGGFSEPILIPVIRVTTGSSQTGGIYDAKSGQFPYLLSLRYVGQHVCSAVLIRDNIALTAAHCLDPRRPFVDPKSPGGYSVMGGSTYVNGNGRVSNIKEIIFDPINSEYARHDTAMLVLSRSLRFPPEIDTISLPSGNEWANGNLTVAGWRNGNERQLKFANVPRENVRKCFAEYRAMFGECAARRVVNSETVCAGYGSMWEGRSKCKLVDDGGPVVGSGFGGRRVLYGIKSRHGCLGNVPGIFYSNIQWTHSALGEFNRDTWAY